MPRLSIFSFDTLQTRVRPGRWLVYWLLLLIAGEGLLSIGAITAHLPRPEPTLWYSPRIQDKLDYLHTFAGTRPLDVLFIGNSTVQAGLNPAQFDEAVANLHVNTLRTGRLRTTIQPGSFNGALEALPPSGILWFLQIYLQDVHPQTIMYGLTPQDLNANNTFAHNVLDLLEDSPEALALTEHGWRGWLTARLLRWSHLYRYRFVLHQWLLRGGLPPAPYKINFDARGFAGGTLRLADEAPDERAKHYAVIGNMHYAIAPAEVEALRQIIQLCAARNVQLVLINMPVADGYYTSFPNADTDYTAYLTALTATADAAHIALWDMEALPPAQAPTDADFYDFHHLNRAGAAKLSALAAARYAKPN
ncbi:MAG: hypothetical protein KDE54_08780 [Caldilineaceae bacterium]|nr:hypothetical protein [Caldilineaceae bacterium]MCB0096822.1 hypothetical protein [Caldilineaceae bacterium]MCB0140240.1 hypothetical protein [Caldilineaceae bacterium]